MKPVMKNLTSIVLLILLPLVAAAQIPVDIGADTTVCSGECVTLDPGNIATGYLWSTGDTTQSITYCASTSSETIVLTVFDMVGGTGIDSMTIFTVSSCDSVWPGDANSNGVADVYDVLTIGQNFGFTGPARANATTNWIGQPATDWAGSAVLNYKHSDCNGNGVVEYADFDVINQNYGLTHNKAFVPFKGKAGAAMLSINIDQDTLYTGDTITFKLDLIDSLGTSLDIYGIAFDMYYDVSLVDTNFAPVYDYSDCFIGTIGQDLYSLDHDTKDLSFLSVGITRLDQRDIFGRGDLVDISFILIDDISGKTGGTVVQLESFFLWVTAVLSDGTNVPIDVSSDSVVIIDRNTGIFDHYTDIETTIYPNPTSGQLNVQVGNVTGNTSIKVYDILGKLIDEQQLYGSGTVQLETTNWPDGNYLLQLINGKAITTKRVTVAH